MPRSEEREEWQPVAKRREIPALVKFESVSNG